MSTITKVPNTRKNEKVSVLDYENSIKKSNEISLAKLNHGLTLNQMQLLAYFIYCTQHNGTTAFKKADFQKKFGIEQYRTEYARADAKKLMDLKISTSDIPNDEFAFWNVFIDIRYKDGVFSFNWNPEFTPHILNLKEKYIINNLKMTSNFKSSYSWILYETLKALYNHYHKVYTKEEILNLFNVEKVKSYVSNTSKFKDNVLDVAIKEVNTYTELEVHYTEIKKGRKVVAFDIHWSSGEQVAAASKKLLGEIKSMIEAVNLDAPKILMIEDPDQREIATRSFSKINSYTRSILEEEFVTKEDAEKAYDDISFNMMIINNIFRKPKEESKSTFYNWLDERE